MFLRIREALDALLNHLAIPIQRIVIAYSGGLDSSVLLHALARDPPFNIKPHVLHIQHQLSPNAAAWALHCQQQAARYQLPYHEEMVTVQVGEYGLEAAARSARYHVFKRYCQAGTAILTAHHADDQAETVLLRILRGTGVAGIAGIPSQRLLGEGVVLRPLLGFDRLDLEAYADKHALSFITDESNLDLKFQRNDCRHRLIPFLLQTNPAVKQHLKQLAINAQEALTILESVVTDAYTACQLTPATQLNLAVLKTYDAIMQREILRYWLVKIHHLTAPSRAQLIRLQQEVIAAASDKIPAIKLGRLYCRRYQGRLYLTPEIQVDLKHVKYAWDLTAPLLTPLGELDPAMVKQNMNLPSNAIIEVRFRQGGERFHPAGRIGSHPLKKCLQEWAIPPWQRYHLPLLYYQDICIMVYGVAVAEGWKSK